ncbi:MAG: SDR family oxidoreductase, partial [Fimbriimonadales bacterium]
AERLWDEAVRDGELHALVNNAGAYTPCPLLESSDEEWLRVWEDTMALNLRAPMVLTRLAAKRFVAQGGGRIVNVASRVGFRGEAGAAAYAASKAALINLTRSLAVELAPRGVLLFGLAPGWVDTAMARTGMQERLPSILETIPLGRMATPEDCANVARFLLSGEADYLSGQTIDINGASYFH